MIDRFFTRERAQDALILFVILLIVGVAFVPAQTQPGHELSLADVLVALRSKKADIGEKNKILTEAVKQRGITFALTPEIEKELDGTGAATELIAAIRTKMPSPPVQTVSKPAPEEVKPVEDFAFFRNRAADETRDGKTDTAIADLEKAIALDPKDAAVRHDHAMLLGQKNDLDAAAAEYSKATELAPQDVRNFIGRASLYERMNRPADALADYQKVLSLNPADKEAATAVVRISGAMTKAAMDLAAKQQPVVEKKTEPISSPATVAKDDNALPKADPAKPQVNDTVTNDPTTIFNAGNLLTYCTDAVKPSYPPQALALRASGDVTVDVKLDADGRVTEAKATSGAGILRAAAETAARRSKFKPVTRNGKPVAASGVMSYTFKM